MDSSSKNFTEKLALAILALSYEKRYPIKLKSVCQFTQCTFPTNDLDNHNGTCHVTSASLTLVDENVQKNLTLTIVAKYIHLYIYPLFILMGIFGNSLSCFIMFINVRRSGYSTSLYLTLLAFVDCLFLLGSALPDWISQIHDKFDIKHLSDLSCRFVYWFGHFTTHLSAGLVVSVTVERFIAVQYPLIAHKLNTVTHTRIVLIILIIFFFLIDSPVLILVKHINEDIHTVLTCHNDTDIHYGKYVLFRCVLTNEHFKQIWVYIDFAIYTFIPFLIIVTLNSLIIRRLIDAQRFRQRMFRFNSTLKCDQTEVKYRHYSESHQAIEILEKHPRYSRRFQSVPETKPLAMMLRPRLSQLEERRRRYSTKQSSLSTELSTLSFEIKTRSQYQYDMPPIRHKPISPSNSNNTRLTILLLFVSCSFLVLTLPSVVYNLIMSIKPSSSSTATTNENNSTNSIMTDKENSSRRILLYTLVRLLMIINHSINFILYFVLGKRFRRDLKQLFRGYWRKFYR